MLPDEKPNADATADAKPEGTDAEQKEPDIIATLTKKAEDLEQTIRVLSGNQRTTRVTLQAVEEMEDRMASTIKKAFEAVNAETDPAERAKKLADVFAEQAQQRQFAARVNKVQPRLQKLLDDSKVSLDDPKLAEVKKLWDGGSPEEAFTEARMALMQAPGTYTKEDLEKATAAASRNAAAEGKRVDTGASSAAGAPAAPKTQADLPAYLQKMREAGKALTREQRAALVQGTPR